MTGTFLGNIPILDTVMPFIKVKATKNKWGREDDDDAEERIDGRRKTGRKSKRKVKENIEQTVDAEDEDAEGEPDPEVQKEHQGDEVLESSAAGDSSATEHVVLVLHRIQSLDLGECGRFLLFSAIGYVCYALIIECSHLF